ncbi:family 16 glycosylhydrolase [Paradesertivirga mongoliensis]|uniref:Family 16 glycosylhydrolase n=1 Tax=Paradesertivirga mongoliensis TaxID=2100740 RepID=A0ABW4ZQW7_9SPHI|nr:family 16 glycosylhydrolase [Pedobacter mongoliensis]
MNTKIKLGILPLLTIFLFSSCRKAGPEGVNADVNASGSGKQSASIMGKPGGGTPTIAWETVMDGTSFTNYSSLESTWNYLYPWGSDHNGSARMYASSTDHSQVYIETSGILTVKATRVPQTEGVSSHDPHLPIRYHSGAIHAKPQVVINSQYDAWELSGDFKAPINSGTWPAFWITGAHSWPPESDILEFKGNNLCWQNTADGPDWTNVGWETVKTVVADAPTNWHNYKVVLTRLNDRRGVPTNNVKCEYYIDGVLKGTHTGTNFFNQTFNIIINMQMEGASGSSGPLGDTFFYAKNIIVKKGKIQ